MAELGIRVLILAQVADAMTFMVMIYRHGLDAELNPVVTMLAEQHGLWLLTAAKIAVVVFAAATVLVVGRSRPWLAAGVLAVGIGAGGLGAVSNIATI